VLGGGLVALFELEDLLELIVEGEELVPRLLRAREVATELFGVLEVEEDEPVPIVMVVIVLVTELKQIR
jgi:hypothetical protein